MMQVYRVAAMATNGERGFDVMFSQTGPTNVNHTQPGCQSQ